MTVTKDTPTQKKIQSKPKTVSKKKKREVLTDPLADLPFYRCPSCGGTSWLKPRFKYQKNLKYCADCNSYMQPWDYSATQELSAAVMGVNAMLNYMQIPGSHGLSYICKGSESIEAATFRLVATLCNAVYKLKEKRHMFADTDLAKARENTRQFELRYRRDKAKKNKIVNLADYRINHHG